MQPYFFPYAGYYRLMREADYFVIFDCVQFPRRGYVHRNRLHKVDGGLDWITLPLEKASQSAKISELRFAAGALEQFQARMRPFACFQPDVWEDAPAELKRLLFQFDRPPVDYLEDTLKHVAARIGAGCQFVRSSQFNLPAELKGQHRVLEIVKELGATRYVNAPGGRDLYDEKYFQEWGVELSFLPLNKASTVSVLETLIRGGSPDL